MYTSDNVSGGANTVMYSSDINPTYFPIFDIICATQNIHNKISLHIVRFNTIELRYV